MIANQAASLTKPISARSVQQSSLLPSKEIQTKDLLESNTKPKSTERRQIQNFSSTKDSETASNASNASNDVKKTNGSSSNKENTTVTSSARSMQHRVRSRTPPPSGNKIPHRKTSISPLRHCGKASPGSRSKSPMRSRADEEDEQKRIMLSPTSQKRSERQNRPSFQGLSVIDGKRKNV